MKFYYCNACNAVFAFNLFNILKHDLEKPEDKTCKVYTSLKNVLKNWNFN